MGYFRHGDPLDDFDRRDAEDARWYARLPKCDECKCTIEDEHYYDIDGEILCEDCLKKKYRKNSYDYAEGNQ